MREFQQIVQELEQRIQGANSDALESGSIARNSYDHGHEVGELYALQQFLDWLLEKDDGY